MDVVDGKIVSARTERAAAEAWSALQPSRGRTVEVMEGNPERLGGDGGDWGAPSSRSDGRPYDPWGGRGVVPWHGPPHSFVPEPGAARWNPRPSVEKHHVGAFREYSGMQPRPVAEHRQGWGGERRRFNFGPKPLRPELETNLDQILEMYESQIVRLVPGSLTNARAPSALGQGSPVPSLRSEISKERCSLRRFGSDANAGPALVGTSSDLKRRRLEATLSDEAGRQSDCGWSPPLKLLLRKGLSMSDVGELGRIIIPKKSAESQFQQIDTKEGILLEMHDYDGSKRWFFRLKWWINNKSRMYVLDNTGEFIKYHGLEEHDLFVLYVDSTKKMVVRGHKGTDLDSMLDDLQGVNAGSSSELKSSSTKEEGPTCTTALG